MRLLDLFSGAGGAAVGYSLAGFDAIVGVDIRDQPRYPFTFVHGEALSFVAENLEELRLTFDAVHASPPCQRYSAATRRWSDASHHPDLIAELRVLLEDLGLPYVIENVMAAPLWNPIRLCGTMFDLGVFRHRQFETSFLLIGPDHERHAGRVGDGRYHTVAGHNGGSSTRDGWIGGSADDWRKAMGIDWMTRDELAQAIPPAYTRYVGAALRAWCQR